MTAIPTKYCNQRLFDYSRVEIEKCIEKLIGQADLYERASRRMKLRMETRGLFSAALTLASTAVVTAKMLERGKFWMNTQFLFFRNRWRQSPGEWGGSA